MECPGRKKQRKFDMSLANIYSWMNFSSSLSWYIEYLSNLMRDWIWSETFILIGEPGHVGLYFGCINCSVFRTVLQLETIVTDSNLFQINSETQCHPRTWGAFDSQPMGEMTALLRHGSQGNMATQPSPLRIPDLYTRSVVKLKGIQRLRPPAGVCWLPPFFPGCQVRLDGAHHGYPRPFQLFLGPNQLELNIDTTYYWSFTVRYGNVVRITCG